MSRLDATTTAAAAFATGVVLLTVTGCAQIGDYLSQQHTETFATYADAEEGWVGVDLPAWIPADATDLRNRATLDETVAVVRVVTDTALTGCAPAERRGLPALAADWSTQEWPDEVQRCGDYEVMPMDDGWLGWFTATEPGQMPG